MRTIDSYTTIVVRGRDVGSVLLADLHLVTSLFTAEDEAYFVVYPEAMPGVPANGDRIAARLSEAFAIALLAEVASGDETFRMRLFEAGKAVDEYIAQPGFWTGDEAPPSGGDAARLSAAFGVDDADTIADLVAMLHADRYDDTFGFATASDRHREIVDLLGLPLASVGISYDDILRGLLPEGVESENALVHVPADHPDSVTIRQFALFDATDSGDDSAVVARFCNDVIATEEEFEESAPAKPLGTAAFLRDIFRRYGAESPEIRFDIDPTPSSSDPSWVRLFTESRRDLEAFPELLRRLLDENGWAAFEYGSRKVWRPASD